MTYSFYTDPKATPQTRAVPGREKEMIASESGAVAFKADNFNILLRCLIEGTVLDSYYSTREQDTQLFMTTLRSCVQEDPVKTADLIVYARNHGAKVSAALLALVELSKGNATAKKKFEEIFPQVVCTGSNFLEWLTYTKHLRGMGDLIKRAGRQWFAQDADQLIYQSLKYQKRGDFSVRDALRLFKPKTEDSKTQKLFAHVTGKLGSEERPYVLPIDPSQRDRIDWVRSIQSNGTQAQIVNAITQGNLTHEMVSGFASMDGQIWEALYTAGIPFRAFLRNIGLLCHYSVLSTLNTQRLMEVRERLLNPEIVRKSGIHPLHVLTALRAYQYGRTFGMSKNPKTWKVIPFLVDTLEALLKLSFDCLEPTNLQYVYAVDVSGSMSSWKVASQDRNGRIREGLITCCEVAAALALACAKTENFYHIIGFSHRIKDLGITKNDTFSAACQKARDNNFGTTDATRAFDWAKKQGIKADSFVFFTDCESYGGSEHLFQALNDYRRFSGKDTRAIYTTLRVSRISLCDPRDPYSMDILGFDSSIPKIVQEFSKLSLH